MSKFEFKKLNELCNKITDGSHYSPVGIENGIPMLSVKDMLDNGFSYNDCKFVSIKDYLDMVRSNCKPLKGDVLIAKDGSYLKHVFVIKEEIDQAVLSSIGILRPNQKIIYPEYLKYYLQTASVKQTVSKKYVSGSALPRIILKNFGEIDVIYRNLIEQNKIASVLSSLDSKIELNNRINAELEQMAKTIYDYWFVQFDFPISAEYAVSVGQPELEGKPFKSSGGRMVWSGELKREVPEGWEVKKLHQIVSVKKDILQTNNLFNDTAYIGLEHIPRKSFTLSTWEIVNKIDSAKFKFEKHDILFGKIRPYFHKVGICLTSGITSVDCIVLRPKNEEYKGLILQTVFSDEFVDVATNSSTGSKMPRADWNILKDYFVINPNNDLLRKFNNFSNNIFETMGNLVSENQKLTELRDWLLPMLMNGQVKVGDEEEDGVMGMAAEGMEAYKVRGE